jgi:hypothetical protein
MPLFSATGVVVPRPTTKSVAVANERSEVASCLCAALDLRTAPANGSAEVASEQTHFS